ncbi:MAG TPA: thiamine-phosphate kinase [Candidatus Acidoferrales bacterium]|nr:thiamine-phosphate kinase [Candidatus Acidoferrales bacterium]
MRREAQLIERIARTLSASRGLPSGRISARGRVRLGIGDDAAIIAPSRSADWVLSCDAFLEGVHFLADHHPADSVGFKSLARAASDLAAMGARPTIFLLTLALPAHRSDRWLDEFLEGMARAARILGMRLAGGDTTRSDAVSISITVVGEAGRGLAVTRSGARPGDIIYVSGRLGAAELGLQLVRNGFLNASGPRTKAQSPLVQRHLYPQIRVRLGLWLARHRIASAMMDISDGLSTDLARLCEASRVGARLWVNRIPRVEVPAGRTGRLARIIANLKLDPLKLALHGGEDYELLFTVPRRYAGRLRRAPGFSHLTAIGEIERGKTIFLAGTDERARQLLPGGWDPFRRK